MRNITTSILSVFFSLFAYCQELDYFEEIDKLYDNAYAHLYRNKDSTSFYFNKILDKAFKKKDWLNVIDALISENRNAGYFYDLKTLKNNLTTLDSLFLHTKNLFKNIENKELYTNSILYDKGNYYYKVNNFKGARKQFQSLISNIEKIPDSEIDLDHIYLLSSSYSFMASMFQDESKYELAKQYYTKDIRFLESKTSNEQEEINTRYSLLASVYSQERDFQSSNELYQKVINGIETENVGNNSYITACNNIAQNYIDLKQNDSASLFLSKVQKHLNPNSALKTNFHVIRSQMFQLENNYDKALDDLEFALKIEEQKDDNGKNLAVAKIYQKIGHLNRTFDYPKKAINQFDSSIKLIRNSTALNDRFFYLELLRNKATILKSPIKALEIAQQGVAILDSIKPTFSVANDKLRLIENSFPLFESGISAAYQLSKELENGNYINEAFNFTEKNKSILLLEALLGAKATKFANIPATILERERQLKSEITFFEKQINQSQEKDAAKEDQLFDLKEEYRKLVKQIESDYKAYYNLKYNTKTLTVVETQKLLQADEQLISYFYGNEAIYAIGLTQNSKQIERIPITDAFEQQIKDVRSMLADPQSTISTLSLASHELYKILVAPFLEGKSFKKLTIITDGLLNYIPFEALNTERNNTSYLVERYAVDYVNSATLYAQLLNRDEVEGKLLAFAPSFDGKTIEVNPSRDKLLPLPHNKREVEQILTSFKGQSFVDQKASLQNFSSQLSQYKMLHLATHGVVNDTLPEYSYLAFSNDGKSENLLYVSDLYNLQIDANLVTLSACDTGIGELKRGEGFLSLARGFFYSGASSIASTLWKINDASTTTLMDSFYKNLSDGATKDVALQKAKISFLNTNRSNGLAHPYYWSGFIISGNTKAIATSDYWLWIGCSVLLSALIFGMLIFRRKNR